MRTKTGLVILFIIVPLLASACTLGRGNKNLSNQALAQATAAAGVSLVVQADTSVPFNTVGQTIAFKLFITNSGGVSLPGLVIITGASASCPDVKTVGNLDTNLDPGEGLTCTYNYSITQNDLAAGNVTLTTTANVNGILSNQAQTVVNMASVKSLTLTKTANPTVYDRAGMTITYTYVIKNAGIQPLGPAQFTVTDAAIPAPINCGDANATLAVNATLTCTATYITTQNDLALNAIASNAAASGGGAGPSQPASATVLKSATPITPSASNLTPGSTVQHKVIDGDWMWQIARCYGVKPTALLQANPQLANPAQISPGMVVTVPNIGSAGTVYGPPCVVSYVVQNGDTWASIAQKYNADAGLVQLVNGGTPTAGRTVTVPRNSFGANVSASTPAPTPSTAGSTRITFTPDGSAPTLSGVAPSGVQPIRYVFTATQGQILNLKVGAAANAASVAVYAPDGSTLKPEDLSPVWSGPLPGTGDYRVEVFNALETGTVSFTLDVNLMGKCVDAIRAVRPAGTVHFNACGQLDPSGKLKVVMIHIRAETGSLKQDLAMPGEVLTPLTDSSSLIVEDLNGDGNDDFRVLNSPATGNPTYQYFLYNPTTKRFEFNGVH